ncbi:conserved Plasmodium protein, unknown function [Plasmodium sp. DRC-Itaito]|nr:conserved Plasmodium protein, unknown function [Plasmodium sp. DRC-Itaito]
MDKDIFNTHKIIEFQANQKNIFQIWKEYVKEELLLMHSEENNTCNNKINNIYNIYNIYNTYNTYNYVYYKKIEKYNHIKSIRNFYKYADEWKELPISLECSEHIYSNYDFIKKKKDRHKKNIKHLDDKEKKSDSQSESEKLKQNENKEIINYQYDTSKSSKIFNNDNQSIKSNKLIDDIKINNKVLSYENYLDIYEKYIECLNKNIEKNLKENETCIVTYNNFINRDINIIYKENINFLKYFYSCLNIIKENKIIIPKGFYLYELIYPQTIHSFPVINKFNYYFVKLFINNKWYLIFVNLYLPYNKNNHHILSCYSTFTQEIWTHILIKALYKCFHLFHFKNYHLHIIEMLTGLKFIKSSFNINKIINNYKNNYIQCILLNQHEKEKSTNNNKKENHNKNIQNFNIGITTMPHNTHYNNNNNNNNKNNSNKNVYKITDNNNKQNIYNQSNNSISIKNNPFFYFLICSFQDKQFISVKCSDIKPDNYIQMSNHTTNQKKEKEKEKNLLKGYKYINTKGNIQISNAQLVPLFKNTPDMDSSQKYIKPSSISTNDHDIKMIYNHNELTYKKYNIVINENTQNVIQSIKDILSNELNKFQKIKNNDDSDKSTTKNIHLKKDNKKNNKDIYKWFKDNEIEKILELINLNYSSEYQIKIDPSLKNKKIVTYLNKNKFELISLNEYIKNRLKPFKEIHKSNSVKNIIPKSDQHIYIDKKKGNNNQTKNDNMDNNHILSDPNMSVLPNDCPYVILICYISIKEEQTENNKKKETNFNIQYDDIKCEKDNVNINKFLDFFIYFFPHQMCKYNNYKEIYNFDEQGKNSEQVRKKKKKKKKKRKKEKKKKKKTASQIFEGRKKKKKKEEEILFLNDMYDSNLFFKKIGERDHNEDIIPFIPCTNFLQQVLNNNDYKNYFFYNKIVKRKIRLEKNKEHFFILYTKRPEYNDFYIEWINEKKQNLERNYMISSSFITIEEYFEKYMKMSMSFLEKKEISLKKEMLNNKVLLKFVVTINMNDKKEENDEHGQDIDVNINHKTHIERINHDISQQLGHFNELINFHFYLIIKINNFNIVPYLNLYMCRIKNDDMLYIQNNIEEEKKIIKNNKIKNNKIKNNKIKNNASKKNNSIYDCEEYFNIVGTFYKYSLDELIYKIYIPLDQINKHHKYLFLLVTKKLLWKYNVNFNIYINVAYPKEDHNICYNNYDNSKKNRKKEIATDIFEVPSCCSNNTFTYTFTVSQKDICKNIMNTDDSNRCNFMNKNILHIDNKNITNMSDVQRLDSYDQKNKNIHDNLCCKNIIQFVKKIILKNKNEYTYGSIFIQLKNCHLYEYIETKIIKIEKSKKKIMTDNHFDLDFILTNYKRKVILSKKKKKNIFFKHVLLNTNDTYIIVIKVKTKNPDNSPKLDLKIINNDTYICKCDSKDIDLNKSLLDDEKNYKYKKETHSNNIIINLDILLNFIDYVHLKDDTTTYEDINTEIDKYKEHKKIDIEQLKFCFSQNILGNIFDFKNEMLLYFKRNYENIYMHIIKNLCDFNNYNKENHQTEYIKRLNDNEKNYNNNKLYINKINDKDKNIKIDHINRQNIKKSIINNISDNNIGSYQENNNLYLNQNVFHYITSNILKYDEESLRYIFYKFFENNIKEIHINKFIEICKNIENIENIKNCSFLIKIEQKIEKNNIFLQSIDNHNNIYNNNNYDIKEKIKYNDNHIINQDNDILFKDIFTYGKKIQNIINDIINFYKIKNKEFNLLKCKMDAELQLNEKCIDNFDFSLNNNINNNNNNNTNTEIFIKNKNIKQIKYIIYYNYKQKEIHIEKQKKKKKFYKSSNYIKERYNQWYKKIIINKTINNINDLINITNNLDNYMDLYSLKEMNKNIIKNIKERKIFLSNFKNNINQKKLKKFQHNEFNNLYRKALQLNLHIYNKEYIKIIKNYIHIFNLLNQIKLLFKNVEWKKKKYTNNFQDIQINDILTDHNIFIHLYKKCIYLITNINDIQLNYNYQNIYKDSTQLYHIITNHELQQNKDLINKNKNSPK